MVNFTAGKWISEPKVSEVTSEFVSITTEPKTDFWQRSYYGFRNENAPPLPTQKVVSFGVYACSPSESSFTAKFTEMSLEPCKWLAH
ncbi:DUF1349 domain-containing protein [Vibrio cholerae]